MFRHLALIAFFIGMIAVGLAAFRNNVIYDKPAPASAPKQERSWKELASEAAKRWVEKKVQPPAPEPPTSHTPDKRFLPLHPYEMLYTALGVAALGLGTFSWSQKRHIRLSGAAAALGIIAVAWEWALIGILIAVALLIIANLS